MASDNPRLSDDDLARRLQRQHYPRSNGYDPRWLLDNMMGPNPLWLVESLTQVLPLAPGMRVLDLGCGKGLTSIFLAREFGVQVWAADLWIKPTDNWGRVREAGLERQIVPLHVEAHTLPFAEGFFDAIVSVDAYHYFGTADLYTSYIARYLAPGGRIGIAVPGLTEELGDLPPAHLAEHWDPDFCSFHSPAWWRQHWQRSGALTIEHADTVPHGWADWLHWNTVCLRAGKGWEPEQKLLEADGGTLLGFTRAVAVRR